MKNDSQKSYEQLCNELEELRKQSKMREEELQATTQQLSANEQQLRAANQQLEANNQQLIASEQELRKEKRLSEKIVETSNAIIVGLDKDHIIRIFNRGAEQITGYKKEEVIGKDWFQIFFPEEMYQEMNAVWNDAWVSPSHSYINPIRSKSGHEIIISWQSSGIHDSDDISKHLHISVGEDITERKLAEATLQKRLLEQKMLLKISQRVNNILDLEKILQEVSDGAAELMGIETAAIYLLEEKELYLGATTPALDPNMPESLRWAHLSDHPHIEKAVADRLPVIINDTQQAKLSPAEQNIAELRQLRTIIHVPLRHKEEVIGLLILGTIGDIHEFSDSELDLCETISNQLVLGIQNARLHKNLNEHINELEAQIAERIKAEENLKAKNQQLRSTEQQLQATNQQLIANSQQLMASEAKFKSYIKNAPDAIFIANEKGEYIEVNETACRITGYSEDELRNVTIPDLIQEEYREKAEKHFQKTIKDGFASTDLGFVTKSGEKRFWNIDAVKLSETRFLGFAKDITERKQDEIELCKAKEKAEEADRLKSAFLANMSHEIRTPMNGILGFTDLLKEPKLTGDQKDKYIQVIEKSGERMLNTINDIIDISKIEAGEVEVVNTELSVQKLLDEQYEFFAREAAEKGLELNYYSPLSDNESRIITDKHKLESILVNLIKNAIKYTETGSISFGYSIQSIKGKNFLEFYIKDTGIGIPADRIDAIFNRFEQADIEDTRVFEGSGLGLAISKSYVEMLGGEMSVSSTEGSGSTFMFSIPYNKEFVKKGDLDNNNENLSETAFHNLSVIVAEDDENSRMYFEALFEHTFKKIHFTTTGNQTIDACREHPDTDIILMDIKMPDINGYQATQEIRKFNTDVIIIAQTAYGLLGDKEKAIEAGCDDYLSKPVKKDILFEKIRACVAKKSR